MGFAQRARLRLCLGKEENEHNGRISNYRERVVGVTFEKSAGSGFPADAVGTGLPDSGTENPFDHNAVKVQRWDKQQVGYLNRELAKILAPRLDLTENCQSYRYCTYWRLLSRCKPWGDGEFRMPE